MRHGFLKKRPATVHRPNAISDSGGTHADLRTQTMKDVIEFIENKGHKPKQARGDKEQVLLAKRIQRVQDSAKPRDAALQALWERYQQMLSQLSCPSGNPPLPASGLAGVKTEASVAMPHYAERTPLKKRTLEELDRDSGSIAGAVEGTPTRVHLTLAAAHTLAQSCRKSPIYGVV